MSTLKQLVWILGLGIASTELSFASAPSVNDGMLWFHVHQMLKKDSPLPEQAKEVVKQTDCGILRYSYTSTMLNIKKAPEGAQLHLPRSWGCCFKQASVIIDNPRGVYEAISTADAFIRLPNNTSVQLSCDDLE